jgi:peptidoglycan/LPS O-acetylase OafA/YrhL
MNENSPILQSKPRYEILDGLRGVAAVVVVAFHIFEAHATSPVNQIINHGYLAVDFFFVLSGFVVGYAYDDRWGTMDLRGFLTRRLIRLHPMVILGSVVGAIAFYFGHGETFPLIAGTPVWKMLVVMLVGFTMVPLLPSMDIRGWQEMYPLNGPAWSLFFEYFANLLYALPRALPSAKMGLRFQRERFRSRTLGRPKFDKPYRESPMGSTRETHQANNYLQDNRRAL